MHHYTCYLDASTCICKLSAIPCTDCYYLDLALRFLVALLPQNVGKFGLGEEPAVIRIGFSEELLVVGGHNIELNETKISI